MKLRYQLLLVGALTLLLPVVAYRSVQQMDVALRDSRAYELRQNADSSRRQLNNSKLLDDMDTDVQPGPRDLYAELITSSLSTAMTLDGYADDWINFELPERLYNYASNKPSGVQQGDNSVAQLSVRLAVTTYNLMMFVKVTDDRVIYHKPASGIVRSEFDVSDTEPVAEQLATGDHLVIFALDANDVMQQVTFSAIAPGPVFGRQYAPTVDGTRQILRLNQYRAYWTATNSGYQIELSLPLPGVNEPFGFALVDVDSTGRTNSGAVSSDAWVGTVDPGNPTGTGRLVYQSTPVENLLSGIVAKGSRARLFDNYGRLRADVNRLYEKPSNPALIDPARTSLFNALLYRFFEWVITTRHRESTDNFPLDNRFRLAVPMVEEAQSGADTAEQNVITGQTRSYTNLDQDQVMGQVQKVSGSRHADMYLLFETNEATANAFTSSAMVRLFSLVTLVSLLVAGSLFCYAIWLSWRIRKLSRQAQSAVGGDGRILASIHGSKAKDEIGEVSRSIALLVERSSGYTQYLESLASRLSHELRTPLSVVQTSLENIGQEQIDKSGHQMLQRAQGGVSQLSGLIRSMSEATRLEQTMLRAEFIDFDASEWLANAVGAYNDIYPDRRFTLLYPDSMPSNLNAVPDLLQQALDKLIGNACDFSPANSEILVQITGDSQVFDLSIQNEFVGDDAQISARFHESVSDQLFEPMYSVRTHNGQESHLGLGLYIVRLIGDAHGGRVYAKCVEGCNAVRIGLTVKCS